MPKFCDKNMFVNIKIFVFNTNLKLSKKKLSEIVVDIFANFTVREKCCHTLLVHMLVQDEQIIE